MFAAFPRAITKYKSEKFIPVDKMTQQKGIRACEKLTYENIPRVSIPIYLHLDYCDVI